MNFTEQKQLLKEAEESLKILKKTAKKLYSLKFNGYYSQHNDYFEINIDKNSISFGFAEDGAWGGVFTELLVIEISKEGTVHLNNIGALFDFKLETIKEISQKIIKKAKKEYKLNK
jgi:hypothetical protein